MTNEQTADARPPQSDHMPPPEPGPRPPNAWELPKGGADQDDEEAGYGYGV